MLLLQVVSFIIYVGYLVAPGFLVAYFLSVKKNTFFLAYGCGITVLVVSQLPFRVFGGAIISWILLVHGLYLLVILVAILVRRRQIKQPVQTSRNYLDIAIFGMFGMAIIYSLYHISVGPYTEIPSDFWARLGHVTDQRIMIEASQFSINSGIRKIFDDTVYIPFLHAVVAHQLNVVPLSLVISATLVSSLMFLTATYWFTLKIVSKVRIGYRQKVFIAFLAVVFTVTTFGVATFSYVRYYAYFPHIFNATLMICTMAIFLDYLEKPSIKSRLLIVIATFVVVMSLVNQQEALMTLVLIAAISIWKSIRTLTRARGKRSFNIQKIRTVGAYVFIVSLVSFIVGLYVGSPGSWREPHLINLGNAIPFLGDWIIANPRLRFWDTLGIFGALVYLWYVLRYQWFKGLDYINVAMISPVFTLFNPLFVVWFLYVASWDPLWRFAYLMPVSTVAAYLVVRSFDYRRGARSTAKIWLDRSFIIVLALCLLPVDTTKFSNTNSRLPSLIRVEERNGSLLWSDLIEYLELQKEEQKFVTDSATNYVLSTALKHKGLPRPKERWQRGDNFFHGDYQDKLLYYGMDDRLLIINNRDGDMSGNGYLSGHWPADFLKVSEKYPPDILDFLNSRPMDFELIWMNNNIFIYRVLRNTDDYS